MNSRWMKSVVLVLCLLLSIPALALAQSGSGNGGNGNGGGNGNVNGRNGSATFRLNNPMPVLIWTVWGLDGSGNGNAGLNTSSDVSSVVLYDNGIAVWNQSNADGSNNSGCTGACVDMAQVSTSDLNTLLQQLRRAGAFRQQANNGNASTSDTSLTTVTVFNFVNGSTQVANTFSFNTAQGRTAGIQNLFSQFLSNNFGSSTINGGSGGSGSGQ